MPSVGAGIGGLVFPAEALMLLGSWLLGHRTAHLCGLVLSDLLREERERDRNMIALKLPPEQWGLTLNLRQAHSQAAYYPSELLHHPALASWPLIPFLPLSV